MPTSSAITRACKPLRPAPVQRSRALWSKVRDRVADQGGSQITDNLGLIVIGVGAVVAIGGLIGVLDKGIFSYVTDQLGIG